MDELNTMFLLSVNGRVHGPCNNKAFSAGTIGAMAEEIHESTQRLYDVVKRVLEIEGQAALARLLNESPQVVNNWEARGLSERGALKAQALVGVDANWLLTGQGSAYAGWPFARVDPTRYFSLRSDDQAWVQARVTQAIEEAEAGGKKQSDADVLANARGVLGKKSTASRKVSQT
jgi:hypothetical protein